MTSPHRVLGIAAPGLPGNLAELDRVAALLGRKPTKGTFYSHWGYWKPFPAEDAEAMRSWGATPEVTWEPWHPELDKRDQPMFRLSRIASGRFDDYIAEYAEGVKAWGRWVRIRPMHEMNGDWYPWCEAVNGNRPGDYVKAWWRIREVFARVGATNVGWIWCPQAPYPGLAGEMADMFPGDGGVNEVALDGYNWHVKPTDGWNPFVGVFARGVRELSALTTRPITIGETGCPEVGGDKAAWIRDMYAALAAWPQVRGVTWFEYAKETDWRIASSEASARAFRDGLAEFLRG